MAGSREGTNEHQLVFLGQAGYPRDAVELQVTRLRKSPAFENRDQARKILHDLVEEALQGRLPDPRDVARRLGKTDIATDDSYLRVGTNRLREKLEEHYAKYAEHDEIRLVIPEKQYAVLAPKNLTEAARYTGSCSAVILQPAEMAYVYQKELVSGRIDALDPDLRAWLVVFASDGFYYPQCRVSRRCPSWTCEVRLGRMHWGKTDGTAFDILLVAADADGDHEIYAYKKRCGDGFGTHLPTDVQVIATRRVVRMDRRSGVKSKKKKVLDVR
jgi:hypothetical protein